MRTEARTLKNFECTVEASSEKLCHGVLTEIAQESRIAIITVRGAALIHAISNLQSLFVLTHFFVRNRKIVDRVTCLGMAFTEFVL